RLDVFSEDLHDMYGEFDLVIADSFVKQFPTSKKIDVLRRLRRCGAPAAAFLFREYPGALSSLLHSFWRRLPEEMIRELLADHGAMTWDQFANMLQALQEYMSRVGATFESVEDLEQSFLDAGLTIRESWSPLSADYIIALATATS
ncbi:MAG TPA: hypothetical protein VMM36_13530, partial [Opitutaceae bacterium]|nr:hypothetical protein [Opitutaceae bacterium]